jgi:hypothetical protein
MIRRAPLLSETPFEAGGKSAFLTRIVGLSAQIFENLVGRDSGHVKRAAFYQRCVRSQKRLACS